MVDISCFMFAECENGLIGLIELHFLHLPGSLYDYDDVITGNSENV